MIATLGGGNLGPYGQAVKRALDKMAEERIMARIWARDHTVWKPEPAEITNRLGWLDTIEVMVEKVDKIRDFARRAAERGLTRVLLMGMGGSSLAPEVLAKVFGPAEGCLELTVLDSTDPGAVLAAAERHDPAATLHLVCSKSGSTVEPLSFFKYFYNRAAAAMGTEAAGGVFAAITDPDSGLAATAEELGFWRTFLNDPDIGGRYSALSHFGLVPGGLIGVNLDALLTSARGAADECAPSRPPETSPGAWLGAVVAELAKAGRDKLTLILSPPIAPFGDWVEQLIAESTGKEGVGVLPVVGERVGPPELYGEDRLIVYLKLAGDDSHDRAVDALEASGQPVVRYEIENAYALGGQFFLWEMATAVAGHLLGINPFDQPNVESAKKLARQMVTDYQESGALPAQEAALREDGIEAFGQVEGGNLAQALKNFLARPEPGAYVAVQAYLQPDAAADRALQELRDHLRELTRLAVTVGYGPRFLHSTGQLHKGDAGKGLFIQLTSQAGPDAPIPDEPGSESSKMSFGLLKTAQALGDGQALVQAGRRVIRFDLGDDPISGIDRLTAALID